MSRTNSTPRKRRILTMALIACLAMGMMLLFITGSTHGDSPARHQAGLLNLTDTAEPPTLTPTFTETPSPTPTETPTLTLTPTDTAMPAPTATPPPPSTPTHAPVLPSTPIPTTDLPPPTPEITATPVPLLPGTGEAQAQVDPLLTAAYALLIVAAFAFLVRMSVFWRR